MSILIIITVIALACSKGGDAVTTPPPPTTTVDCGTVDSRYGTVVSVIIQNSCAISGCHNAGSTNGPGPLTNFTQVKAASSQVAGSVAAGSMPKGSVLSTAQKNAIACWVSSGALNN